MEGVEKEGEVPEGLSRELCAEEMGKKLEILAKAAKEKEETAGKAEECGEWRGWVMCSAEIAGRAGCAIGEVRFGF